MGRSLIGAFLAREVEKLLISLGAHYKRLHHDDIHVLCKVAEPGTSSLTPTTAPVPTPIPLHLHPNSPPQPPIRSSNAWGRQTPLSFLPSFLLHRDSLPPKPLSRANNGLKRQPAKPQSPQPQGCRCRAERDGGEVRTGREDTFRRALFVLH